MAQSGLEFTVWDWFAKKEGKSGKDCSAVHATVSQSVSVWAFRKTSPRCSKWLAAISTRATNASSSRSSRVGILNRPVPCVKAGPIYCLQVDANSIYHLSDAEHLAQLDQYNLLLVEQPLEHDDIFDHAKLQPKLKSPICLDESIVSPAHARWAIEMNACNVINIKPSRIGGFGDAIKIHDMAQAARHSSLAWRHVGNRHRTHWQCRTGQPAQLHPAR